MPSDVTRTILAITDPTLEPDQLSIDDIESEEGNNPDSDNIPKPTAIIGNIYPYIIINRYTINYGDLNNFRLDCDGFLPRVQISFDDTRGEFIPLYYPRDGDVISIFIKPNDIQVYRSIRIDFDIVQIKSSLTGLITIAGIMKVPNLYSEVQQIFPNEISFNVLDLAAQEIGLGYASNDIETIDSQTWINPYDTRKKFISDVTTHAYKDEDSFFTSFVDYHYYLNFVNVNNQFTQDDEVEEGIMSFVNQQDVDKGDTEQLTRSAPLALTNHPQNGETNTGIEAYTMLNNSGDVWIRNGYKRFAQFFDTRDQTFYSQFIEPFTTEGAEEDFQLLKGRPDEEFFDTHEKYKWMGVQSENSHESFLYAQILNKQNLEEINKIQMIVRLAVSNFGLYKFQRIPIIIYETDEAKIEQLKEHDVQAGVIDEDQLDGFTDTVWLNRVISGYYVIQNITYKYSRGDEKITQELLLTRREWPFQFNKDQRTNKSNLQE